MAGGATIRMSADEKRKAILKIYQTTKAVYTEKEILTLASKAGVNANTVLDMNQSLVDDGLVDKEKIGGSNYYWSFPAKKDRLVQVQYQKTLDEIVHLQTVLAETNSKLLDAKRGREEENDNDDNDNNNDNITNEKKNENEGPDSNKNGDLDNDDEPNENEPVAKKAKKLTRGDKLQRLAEVRIEKAKIEAALSSCRDNDPQAIADLHQELQFVQQAANRWTDNIFNCQEYLIKKRGMDKKETCRLLGITPNFDYPEDKIPK